MMKAYYVCVQCFWIVLRFFVGVLVFFLRQFAHGYFEMICFPVGINLAYVKDPSLLIRVIFIKIFAMI